MFAATVAYALPNGSRTLVDRIADPIPNGDDGFDRIHVHFGAADDDAEGVRHVHDRVRRTLAADPAVLKLRLHLPGPVRQCRARAAGAQRRSLGTRRAHADRGDRAGVRKPADASHVLRIRHVQGDAGGTEAHIAHVSAFAVSGVYTYVRDKQLTTAGLRGSRQAQLIERLGANNQIAADVRELMQTGSTSGRSA